MNRRTGLALILALFILALGCTALAEFNAPFVSDGRATFNMGSMANRVVGVESAEDPYGEGVYTESNGTLKIKIDDEATNWEQILSRGGGLPYVYLAPSVDNPDSSKYTAVRSFNGDISSQSESEMQRYLIQEIYQVLSDLEGMMPENATPEEMEEFWARESENSNYWEHNIEIGEVLADQGLLIPISDDYGGAYLCWYNTRDLFNIYQFNRDEESFINAASGAVFYEHLFIRVSHTKDEAFPVPTKMATTYCLEPTKSLAQHSVVDFDEASFADDEITFLVDTDNYTGDEDTVPVKIKVRAPQNLSHPVTYVKVYDAWGDNQEIYPGDDGLFAFDMNYHIFDMGIEEHPFTLCWIYDDPDQGITEVLDYGSFYCYVRPKTIHYWPYYVGVHEATGLEWKPVPAKRLNIVDENSGGKLVYNEEIGVMRDTFDADAKISGNPSRATVWVEAPKGATHYRSNTSGGNNIMGKDDYRPNDMHDRIVNPTEEENTNAKAAPSIVRDHPLLRTVQAGPVKVFLQNEPAYPYGGNVTVIYWYASDADDAQPIMVEYLIETLEEFCVFERTDCVADESMITAPVEKITAIGEDCAAMNWNLVIRHDLQNGVNAVHYELYLEDDDGNYQLPTGEKMVFYVPYPEGTGMDTGHEFQLLHFNGSYSRSENVAVTLTPYGVRFEVTSLSPFTLSWGDAFNNENASELPPTGDNTPIALYAILMLAAAIGLMVSRRKVRG